LRKSADMGGVAGIGFKRVQALGRGPNVDMVRAGRTVVVEEARWRIGGGEREDIKMRRRGIKALEGNRDRC
jgi:hypothetical protein